MFKGRQVTLNLTERSHSMSKNARKCKLCNHVLTGYQKKFCSKSCAATYNNRGVRRHGSPKKCVRCGGKLYRGLKYCSLCWKNYSSEIISEISINRRRNPPSEIVCSCCGHSFYTYHRSAMFCSPECHKRHMFEKRIKECFSSGIIHEKNVKNLSGPKNVLIEIKGHHCEVCGRKSWMKKPIPLIYDHIDGNSSNGRSDNARLVCGNCDMQLPTYKNKNKGNGRKWRK